MSKPKTQPAAHILRLIDSDRWLLVSNPKWKDPFPEYAALTMLLCNPILEYVEWSDRATVCRVVRQHHLINYFQDA